MGPPTILSKEEEDLLVRWLLANAKKGFPINKTSLCETVCEIIKNDDRVHKFRDGVPGKKWFSSFLKRHPEITQRHAESINGARACVTEASIRAWHASVRTYLIEENAEDIVSDPTRILNSDESGFATNPKTGLVLGPRGMKNFYEVKSGSEKECITSLFTISADGEIYPPMIVYPYERIPAEIVRNTNPEWVIGRSKKGWMTSETFFSYVANTLLPQLRNKGIKLPILYILDGHKSHLTYCLSKFCGENGIFLYALLPNATHILQPADVSLFFPLKCKWKNVVSEWKKSNNNKIVNKATFPILLEKSVQQISLETVKNGFRKCGLYPFDVEAVDFSKCMRDSSRILGDSTKNETTKPTTFDVPHFLYFDSLISSERREQFKQAEAGEWIGDESAKELYYVWRKLKKRCQDQKTENILLDTENQETRQKTSDTELENNIETTNQETEYQETSNTELEDIIETTNQEAGYNKYCDATNNILIEREEDAAKEQKRVIIHSDITLKLPVLQSGTKKVSAAFLDHIFWPEESPEKKEISKKEKLPYATTSRKWLQFHEEKETIKKEKERAKKEKASLRKRKQEEKAKEAEIKKSKASKIKKRRNKINDLNSSESEEEEWQESGSSMDDVSSEHYSSDNENEDPNVSKKLKQDIKIGDFYVVAFPGKKKYHNYVCSVQNMYGCEYEVQAFTPVEESNTLFNVIENDISIVNVDQFVKKLDTPDVIISGNRTKFKFAKDVF
ncbi:uncharacterized protein LOC116182378 [Photinus pyralis]|nr:uncharacterized protein LOC116182378 [Photinus pyralis]